MMAKAKRCSRLRRAPFPFHTMLLALISVLPMQQAGAEEDMEPSINWNRESLSGDWSGMRSNWSVRGINLEFMLRGTLMRSTSGGARPGAAYMQNIEAKLGLDTRKLWGIADSSAFMHVIFNHGSKINQNNVGSSMGVDNLEVPDNTAKLYQAWFNKNFFDSRFSLLAGIYPIDTEFYVSDAASVFLHPSFGMSAELAQTNANGPSIYPMSSLGVRAKFQPTAVLYAQAAVIDGDPGNSRNPHWAHFAPLHGDGSFAIFEAGYYPAEAGQMIEELEPEKGAISSETRRMEERYEAAGKYAIGAWSYSKPFPDLVDVDVSGNPISRKNGGAYLLMEQSLYRTDSLSRDLAVFLRYGQAAKDINPADYSLSAGLRFRGIIERRQDDTFGLAFTQFHSSPKFFQASQAAGIQASSFETAIEATYRIHLTPWLAIQPSIERIIHPGRVATAKTATVIGVRFDLWL